MTAGGGLALWLGIALGVAGATLPPAGPEPAWNVRVGFFRSGPTRLALAESYEREGKWKHAAKAYRRLAKAARRPGNQAYAWLHSARCFLRAGKYYTAFNLYKKLVEEYPLYAARKEVLQNLRAIGEAFASGRATIFHFKSPSKAVEVYQEILRLAPAGPNAVADTMKLARYQVAAGRWIEAAETYRDLLKRYPQAWDAHLQLASALMHMARAGDGDGRLRREARRELETYLQNAPKTADRKLAKDMLQLVRYSLAADLVQLGRFYDRKPHYRPRAARRYLYDVLRKYGETALAPVAESLLARIELQPLPEAAKPPARAGRRRETVALAGKKKPLRRPGKKTPSLPGRKPGRVAPEPPAAPPKGVRWLKEQEKVKKWLLPLEDIHTDIEKR